MHDRSGRHRQQLPRLGDRGDGTPERAGELCRVGDELGVRGREHSFPKVHAVLEPDADAAGAEEKPDCEQPPLVTPDRGHAPVRSGRQRRWG